MINDMVHQLKKCKTEEQNRFLLESQELDYNTLFLRIDRSQSFEDQIPRLEQQLFYRLKASKYKEEMESMMVEKKELADWLRPQNYYSDYLSPNKSVDDTKMLMNTNHMTLFLKTDIVMGKKEPAAFKNMKELTLDGKLQRHILSFSQEVEHRKVKKVQETFQKAGAEGGYGSFYPSLQEYIEGGVRKSCIEECINYFANHIGTIAVWLRTWERISSLKTVKLFLTFENSEWYYEQEYLLYMLGYGFSKSEFNQLADGKLYGAVNGNFNLNDRKPYLKLHGMKAKIPMRGTTEDIVLRTGVLKWIEKEPVTKPFTKPYAFLERAGSMRYPYGGSYLFKTEFSNKQQVITAYDNIPFEPEETLLRQNRSFRLIDVWGETKEERILTRNSLYQEVNKTAYFGLLDVCMKMDNGMFFKSNVYKDALKKRTTSRRMAVQMCQNKEMWENWFVRGIEPMHGDAVVKVIADVLLESFLNLDLSFSRLKRLFSLYVSFQHYFKGESKMEQYLTRVIDDAVEVLGMEKSRNCKDRIEFYFLAGQCATYLAKRSQAQNKTLDLLQPFFNCKTAGDIKGQLYAFSQKYGHGVSINLDKRFRKILSMVSAYNLNEGMNTTDKGMFLAGLMADSVLYAKKSADSTGDKEGAEK